MGIMGGRSGFPKVPTKNQKRIGEMMGNIKVAKQQLEFRRKERQRERFKHKMCKLFNKDPDPYQEVYTIAQKNIYEDSFSYVLYRVCEQWGVDPENLDDETYKKIQSITRFLDNHQWIKDIAKIDASDTYDGSVPDEPKELTLEELNKLDKIYKENLKVAENMAKRTDDGKLKVDYFCQKKDPREEVEIFKY